MSSNSSKYTLHIDEGERHLIVAALEEAKTNLVAEIKVASYNEHPTTHRRDLVVHYSKLIDALLNPVD